MIVAAEQRKLQLYELDELQLFSYEKCKNLQEED